MDVLPELETGGIDISTARPAGLMLRGRVVNAAGQPVSRGVALLTDVPATGAVPTRTQVPIVDGAFEFLSVREGEYDVLITAPPAPYLVLTHRNGQQVDGTALPATEYLAASVTIGDRPLDLSLQTGPPSTLRGSLVVEGDAPEPSPAALRFRPIGGRGLAPTSGVSADGTFQMTDLIATLRIGLAGAPAGWWLKAFMVNGVNAAEEPIDFSGGRQSSNSVRAVLARTSRLTGRVTNAAGDQVRGMVVAFPLEPDRRWGSSPYVRTAPVNGDGTYTVQVPPGQYFVAAVRVRPPRAGPSRSPRRRWPSEDWGP